MPPELTPTISSWPTCSARLSAPTSSAQGAAGRGELLVGSGVGDTVDLGVGLALTRWVVGAGVLTADATGVSGGWLPHETSAAQATTDRTTAQLLRAARI